MALVQGLGRRKIFEPKTEKKLRRHQSTRQLMGIDQLTDHGLKTAKGELVFYLVSPDSLQLEESEFELIRYPQRGICLYKCGNERR